MTGGNNLIKKLMSKYFLGDLFLLNIKKKLIPDNFLGKILFKLLIFFENKFNNFFFRKFSIYNCCSNKKIIMISIIVVSLNTKKDFKKTIKSIN